MHSYNTYTSHTFISKYYKKFEYHILPYYILSIHLSGPIITYCILLRYFPYSTSNRWHFVNSLFIDTIQFLQKFPRKYYVSPENDISTYNTHCKCIYPASISIVHLYFDLYTSMYFRLANFLVDIFWFIFFISTNIYKITKIRHFSWVTTYRYWNIILFTSPALTYMDLGT